MTQQTLFGGGWTQRKLEVLKKYLQAYTRVFKRSERGGFYTISYVDAFAGTGTLRRPALGGLAKYFPELQNEETEFRKGSVRRALEIEPHFDKYVFIEKDPKKCAELEAALDEYLDLRNVRVLNEDANDALLDWCRNLNARQERAVVFLDPFGASVKWDVIRALGQTSAVDLWVLLTSIFGTDEWEGSFYTTTAFKSILDSRRIESVRRSANHRNIIDFFVTRLKREFVDVSRPFPLHNSKGSLLFILFFAAGNAQSAKLGLKIANDIIGKSIDS
jgi:three-Cys-motif partner protein